MTSGVHTYVGNESTCQLILELEGTKVVYCKLFRDNAIHRMACVHCSQRLEARRGDGEEVCRFCFPIFLSALPPKTCQACTEGTWHT